jgi:mono/diheme cytochrome c family protein
MRRLICLAAACLVTTIASVAAEKPKERPRAWLAPSSADARQNPLSHRSDVEAGGRKVFRQRCSACHGEDGSGGNGGPNLMTARVQNQSDGALFWKVSTGNTRTGMPTFSFLPEAQRWQLVMHLRAKARSTSRADVRENLVPLLRH